MNRGPRQNNLAGPFAAAFEIEHEARIVALREEYLRAECVANGLERAWKTAVAQYLPILEKKAGLIRGNAYTFPQEVAARAGSATTTLIYSHAEAYEWGLPGFYFWPTTTKGLRSKRGPCRCLGLDEVSNHWKHAPMALQESERPNAK